MTVPTLRRLWRRLLNTLRPDAADADLSRELASHLAMAEEDLVRRGLTPAEARRRARLAIGGVEQTRQRHRDARAFRWLDELAGDVSYSARLLRRDPVFAATAILSLAIGIGATTTVFTAIDGLLVRTAPGVAQPERLVDVNRRQGPVGVEPVTMRQYDEIRARATRLEQVYAYGLNLTPFSLLDAAGQREAEAVLADVVTQNFFTALGDQPAAGRMFGEADGADVVVLSDRFWRRRFNADPAVVGRPLHLGDRFVTVVGVAAADFLGNTVLAPEFWLPVDRTRGLDIGLVGARLKPGVSIAEANAEMEVIGRTLSGGFPDPDGAGTGRDGVPRFHYTITRSSPIPAGVRLLVGGFLALLLAIGLLVLLVACANIAGVLLARSAARGRETAVRLALGVGRGRLVRQLLTETLVLFALGGAAGLALSRAMAVAVLRLLPSFPLPSYVPLKLDAGVAVFATAVTGITALAFGLAPALQATKVDVIAVLKAREQRPSGSLRLRRLFVVAQVALSVLLVVVAGLLTRSLARAGSLDQGFDSRDVEVAAIDLSLAGYTGSTGPLFANDFVARVRRMPGVEHAALASATPSSGMMGFQISIPGRAPADGRPFTTALGNVVGPGYFATIRMPLEAGRDFDERDSAASAGVAIVSEAAARRYWPGMPASAAVGRQILMQPTLILPLTRQQAAPLTLTVVGVVGDLRRREVRESLYVPFAQQYSPAMKLLARTATGRPLGGELRALVAAMDRRLPLLSSYALDTEAGPVESQLRIAAPIAAALGIVGFLLAAIGVYGVTAHMVTRRTREIGIRMALGADRGAVVRMVLGDGLRLVALGAAAGLAAAVIAGRVMASLLSGMAAVDPFISATTLTLFAALGVAASYVPLRRALSINPTQALRYD
jgi:predicted permease